MAPTKCDGAGSSRMGVAGHGQRAVLGSVLGLGRTSGIAPERATDRCGRHWSGVMKADVVRGRAIRSCSGFAARIPECVQLWRQGGRLMMTSGRSDGHPAR